MMTILGLARSDISLRTPGVSVTALLAQPHISPGMVTKEAGYLAIRPYT